MMRLILCRWLGLHQVPPGVDPKWALVFVCERCAHLVDGELRRRSKR